MLITTPASLSSSSDGKWARIFSGSMKSLDNGSKPAASLSFNTRKAWKEEGNQKRDLHEL